MILLEPGNRILGETVASLIHPPEVVMSDDDQTGKMTSASGAVAAPREPSDVRLCDFDDVSYRVVIDANARTTLRVSMGLPCYKAIAQFGGQAALQQCYAGLVAPQADVGYDLTLVIDLAKLDAQKNKAANDALVAQLSLLKSNVIGGVFHYYFQPLLAGVTSGPSRTQAFQFALRRDTIVYLIPKPDRVIVVFSLDFTADTDRAIAKVFMQEFVDARRRLGAAPPCTFTLMPPIELKEAFNMNAPTNNLGFLAFAVLKSHLEAGRLARVASTMQQFRNYLQYHIKCSKSYFHSRMRARVVTSLKILNRARIEHPPELKQKEMKTIQGKTFIRQS